MDDVAYYESQVHYQKKLGEIEKERLQLEREMFTMMRSDKKLHNLKTVKLRSYWQQVCEREKIAKERNEDLLRDFEQMEIKLSAMESKTNKLRRMKMDYDEKVKQMYPKWRHEVEISRAKKQLQERGIDLRQSPLHKSLIPEDFGAHQTTAVVQGHLHQPVRLQEEVTANIPVTEEKISAKNLVRAHTPESVNVSYQSEKHVTTITTPTRTFAASESQSFQTPNELSQQASLQPPPESFADTTPQKALHTIASTLKSTNETSNVVHTIPTALSSDGGNSDFSETSIVSGSQNKNKDSISVATPGNSNTIPMALTYTSQENELNKDLHHSSILSHVTTPAKSNKSDLTFSSGHHSPEKSYVIPEGRETTSSHSHTPTATSSPIKNSHLFSASISSITSQHDKAKSPELKQDSRLSISSFGSDMSPRSNMSPRSDTSPRLDAPLTANAAYQALLKQHSGANPESLHIPEIEEESDEDDLENLLSPHGAGKERFESHHSEGSDSEEDSMSSPKQNAPVYIPTAISATSSSQQYQQSKRRAVPKAPWDTDSEDEIENTNMSNTGGSSKWDQKLKKYDKDDQDDFDFYD